MNIEHFLTKAAPRWMQMDSSNSDIVMSTRIRLARNLADVKFPISFSEQEAKYVDEKVMQTLLTLNNKDFHFSYFTIKEMPLLQRQILIEKHLISPYLAKKEKVASVFLEREEAISVMVNEEDHIRIQCLAPGMQIEQAYEAAMKIDRYLGEQVTYAYHEQFGYLTSCPTNVGTGLRASVMMHLPALTMSKQMNILIQMMTRLGMVVRGIYGEGSENLGNVYQISNQVTLGKSETDILEELRNIVEQVIQKERLARKQLLERAPVVLEDRLSRALGSLKFARILTSEEAATCLSNVRLGVDLGLIEGISQNRLNECMLFIQPGFIQQYAGTALQPAERDMYRAKLVQQQLLQVENPDQGDKGEEQYDV